MSLFSESKLAPFLSKILNGHIQSYESSSEFPWTTLHRAASELEMLLRQPNPVHRHWALASTPALLNACAAKASSDSASVSKEDRFVVDKIVLTLADTYRSFSDNSLRYAIMELFQQFGSYISAGFLVKNYDQSSIVESIRRINTVMLSNDVTARTITLKIFVTIPRFLCSDLLVQRSLLTSLTSSTTSEVHAGLEAAFALSSYSDTFARDSVGIICTMTAADETPVPTKILGIKVLRNYTYTPQMVEDVRTVLEKYLQPAVQSALVISAVASMRFLTERAPHIAKSLHPLLLSLLDRADDYISSAALNALGTQCTLSNCTPLLHFLQHSSNPFVQQRTLICIRKIITQTQNVPDLELLLNVCNLFIYSTHSPISESVLCILTALSQIRDILSNDEHRETLISLLKKTFSFHISFPQLAESLLLSAITCALALNAVQTLTSLILEEISKPMISYDKVKLLGNCLFVTKQYNTYEKMMILAENTEDPATRFLFISLSLTLGSQATVNIESFTNLLDRTLLSHLSSSLSDAWNTNRIAQECLSKGFPHQASALVSAYMDLTTSSYPRLLYLIASAEDQLNADVAKASIAKKSFHSVISQAIQTAMCAFQDAENLIRCFCPNVLEKDCFSILSLRKSELSLIFQMWSILRTAGDETQLKDLQVPFSSIRSSCVQLIRTSASLREKLKDDIPLSTWHIQLRRLQNIASQPFRSNLKQNQSDVIKQIVVDIVNLLLEAKCYPRTFLLLR